MRLWDLSAGNAKIEQALDSLKKQTAEVAERWDDDTFRSFVETYLDPLEPRVQRAIEAIHRLDQLLGRAQRECGSY